jgi:cytochrome c oxidase subunit 2
MFAWGAKLYLHVSRPPQDAMELYVTGKQWMWKIQHPEGRKEIDELHVPLGQDVKLTMTSEDVIHSFFIPAFRVKRDVIPGRYTSEWFRATELGEYHIFCSQYCGRDHSRMVGKVTVMDPAKYQDWLSGAMPDMSSTAAGEKLFVTYGCLACHAAQAPTMAGLFGSKVNVTESGRKEVVTADDEYIRESILFPRAKIVEGYPDNVMPSFVVRLNEEQVMQLIAYIKSLGDTSKHRPTPGPGGTTGQ